MSYSLFCVSLDVASFCSFSITNCSYVSEVRFRIRLCMMQEILAHMRPKTRPPRQMATVALTNEAPRPVWAMVWAIVVWVNNWSWVGRRYRKSLPTWYSSVQRNPIVNGLDIICNAISTITLALKQTAKRIARGIWMPITGINVKIQPA